MFADFAPAPGLTKKDPAVSQVPEEIHWSREAIHSRIFLAQNLGLSICAVNQTLLGPAPHPEEPLGQLFQPLVSILQRFGQYPFNYGSELGLPPVVAGCRLRTGRITEVSALKQGTCCRGIEPRVIAVRERKPRHCIPGPCVFFYERSRHSSV